MRRIYQFTLSLYLLVRHCESFKQEYSRTVYPRNRIRTKNENIIIAACDATCVILLKPFTVAVG